MHPEEGLAVNLNLTFTQILGNDVQLSSAL